MKAVKNWLEQNLKGDPVIWGIVILLSIISILVVYSATGALAYKNAGGDVEQYLLRHSMLVIVGMLVMWLAHKVPYRMYAGLSTIALWVSVGLLTYTYLFGTNLNQASRWLTIPLVNLAFQPSDLAKLALITTMAGMLAKRQQNIKDFKGTFLPVMVWVGVICLLIGLADLSTSILLLMTCFLLMFIGRVPVKYIATLCLIGGLALSMAVLLGQRGETMVTRVKHFMPGTEHEIPFQLEQSYIAIATGGVTGKGPGKSEQRNSLPHPYSDFIFAILVEEYGVVGGAGVLFLYLALLYRGMRIVAFSQKPFGGLLSAGLSFALVLQAMVNMAVAVGLGPVTGLPLPMLSMGGTSLLFTGLSVGIVLSVSRGDHRDQAEQKTGERQFAPSV